MAKPKLPAYAKRIETLAKKLAELKDRGSRRRFLPPMSDAEITAVEAKIGVPLPDEMRAFYREVASGERPIGEPALLPLDQAITVAPVKPAEPFPFGDAQAQELMAKNQKKARNAPSAALPGPQHGALPVMDLSSAIDCVVLQGEQRGKVWQLWDGGWTPHFVVKKGSPVQLDFLAWVEAIVADALAAAPPPITPDTKAVNLMNCALGELPPALRAATQVETLRAPGNQMAELPAWLGELQRLVELRIGVNPLRSLPDSLGQLAALQVLDLSATQLTALPPWIGQLRALRQLLASMSQLESVPEEIGNLAELTHLNLRQNKLRALPGALGNLASLTELDIAKNALTELPASMGRLTHLRTLKLEDNPLRALPPELAALPLDALRLEALPDLDWESAIDVVSKMPALTSLHIKQPLSALPGALSRMKGLKTLGLIGLGLTEVPPQVTELPAIETLSLDQNQLTTLPDAISRMPALKTVVLFANPIAKDEVARLRAQWPHLKIEHF